MMRGSRFAGWCLVLLLWSLAAHALDVQATLDRSTVQLGETVTLNVRVGGATSNVDAPDLSVLSQDFDVLGSSQNRSVSIVNGVRHAELTFGVALRPTHAGTLQIPALPVAGEHTAPLQLQVTAPSAASDTTTIAPNQDVFLEAQVDPTHAYVGQQLSYVVRLYYAVNLGGTLQTPQIDGVQTQQVGDDVKYVTQRDGRSWRVLERRFALTPQHAGPLVIPALTFQGEIADPNDLNSFFGGSAPVSARAPALTVNVRAEPDTADKSAWLPARELTLTLEGLPAAQTSVRVGQAVNLSMTMQATGLAADALPALSLPSLDGATVYPDKAVSTTGNDGPWLLGRQQRKFAVVPERAGTLTIPATSVTWWNVLADKQEVAQIPARQFTVLPAPGVAGGTPVQPAVVAAASSAGAPLPTAPIQVVPWRWVALGSLGLWLVSVLVWWYWRRRRATPIQPPPDAAGEPASARECQRAFLAAARGTDVTAQTRTLLAWARAERPSIQHLGELAAALADAQQCTAVADLQRRRYGGANPPTSTVGLGDVFKRGLMWRQNGPSTVQSSVPPLYPFKLHPDQERGR
ncbi:MAG: BatD family protein [Rhodanobacter sp.]